jgi:hypothetical protein
MDFRIELQLAEACGPLNRWFCAQAYGREMDHRTVEDREILLTHYIRSGGAEDFAKRYAQAMGTLNRWYCSEFYRREIRDPEILWHYFMKYAPAGAVGKDCRNEPTDIRGEMSVAC